MGGTTTLSVSAGRASGVAPLSVFFDATGTTSSETPRPFHDIEYRWNFGETTGPGAGTWNQGSKPGTASRNEATGPVAAHVFETPGTYTVTVADAANTVSYSCNITVDDPEAVFAGARTACFSTTGNFTGCPLGASHLTTSDFASVKSAATAGNSVRRLLLRRGEKWTASATANFAVPGPGLIGAFGVGERPIIRVAAGYTASTPVISFSSGITPTMKDWRLMDVSLDGSLNPNPRTWGVGAMGGIDQLTILRVNSNALRLGVLLSDSLLNIWNADANTVRHGHKVWDQLSIVDMDITNMPAGVATDTNTWSYGTFLSGERVFYAGNSMDGRGTTTPGVSHNARFTYLGKAAISNNTLMRAGPTEHSIKLHGPAWGSTGVTGSRGIGQGYTRWVVISDNKIVASQGGWPVAIGPQDKQTDERGRDIILERNWHVAGPATQWHQMIWFSDVTTRNNLFDMTGALAHGGVSIGPRAEFQVPPNQVQVYNNTFYSPDVDNDFVAVKLHPAVTHPVVKNNLGYAPRDTRRTMVEGTGSSAAPLEQSHNSLNLLVDPRFVGPLTSPSGFRLQADSYAKGSGTATNVFSDFFGVPRTMNVAPDLGSTK